MKDEIIKLSASIIVGAVLWALAFSLPNFWSVPVIIALLITTVVIGSVLDDITNSEWGMVFFILALMAVGFGTAPLFDKGDKEIVYSQEPVVVKEFWGEVAMHTRTETYTEGGYVIGWVYERQRTYLETIEFRCDEALTIVVDNKALLCDSNTVLTVPVPNKHKVLLVQGEVVKEYSLKVR